MDSTDNKHPSPSDPTPTENELPNSPETPSEPLTELDTPYPEPQETWLPEEVFGKPLKIRPPEEGSKPGMVYEL